MMICIFIQGYLPMFKLTWCVARGLMWPGSEQVKRRAGLLFAGHLLSQPSGDLAALGESQSKMDDDWGYHHFRNPHLEMAPQQFAQTKVES